VTGGFLLPTRACQGPSFPHNPHHQMNAQLGILVVLFSLVSSVCGQILTANSSPTTGYYSDAIRRRGIEFYASLTYDANGQLAFEAVRVNPDNSQEVFPGVITSFEGNRITGVIPGRGKFRLKFSRDGALAKGSLTLRRVASGDIPVSGRLRMERWLVEPESVTLNYGVVVQMIFAEAAGSPVANWREALQRLDGLREHVPVVRETLP
jgi:hypothetical protein